MDNKYRFGRIDVNCEGYDYPEDPYILRGSCGVSTKIDKCFAPHSLSCQLISSMSVKSSPH